MKSKKIHTHKIHEAFKDKPFFLHTTSGCEKSPSVNYVHKDDYYLFLFLRKGKIKLLIDFKEYEMHGASILCVLPGQVHHLTNYKSIQGCVLGVDPMLIKDKYKKVLDKLSFLNIKPQLDKDTIHELKQCITAIEARYNRNKQTVEQETLFDLISYYVGIISEIYQREFPPVKHNRHTTITTQFKSLLLRNYQTLKRPHQYASLLNISEVYLYEAVKNTTGFSVQNFILNENILQAKRLLFHTNLSIKEIALKLGYDDSAYFTRLFTKSVKLTPTKFREKHLK